MRKKFYTSPPRVKYLFNITKLEITKDMGLKKGISYESVAMIDYLGQEERVTKTALAFAKTVFTDKVVEADISRYERI